MKKVLITLTLLLTLGMTTEILLKVLQYLLLFHQFQ